MKHLLIMRHAKSSWKQEGMSDHDRPLNRRGRHDAASMAQRLGARRLLPDWILASTALRAQATAESVAEHADFRGALELERSLYLAAPTAYLERLAVLDESCGARVMVIGHNPGLEELLWQLTGQDHRLPTAALAQLELPVDHWHQLLNPPPARLLDLWLPRD